MPISFVTIPELYHVGSLDHQRRDVARSSLEAFMLSVSVDPDEWSSIAQCGGTVWTLFSESARLLDVHALDDGDQEVILQWAVDAGYAERSHIWRVWSYNDEADDFGYLEVFSQEAAEAEADDGFDEDQGYPTENGCQIEVIDGFRLTEAGLAALERWHGPGDAFGGAVILYTREVLAPADPLCAGAWWADDYRPEALSCPRGGLLPERLDLFEIGDENGNPPPALLRGRQMDAAMDVAP